MSLLPSLITLIWVVVSLYPYIVTPSTAGELSVPSTNPNAPHLVGSFKAPENAARRRITIIASSNDQPYQYSDFLNELKASGYAHYSINLKQLSLELQNKDTEENVIVFDGNYGSEANKIASALMEFVDGGGNMLLINDERAVYPLSEILAAACGIKYLSTEHKLMEVFSKNNDVEVDIKPMHPISSVVGKIRYNGFVYLHDPWNYLTFSLLQPSTNNVVWDGKTDDAVPCGSQASLVSAMQGRNGARVVFVGSSSIFSNDFKAAEASAAWLKDVVDWCFQHRGIIAHSMLKHHKVGESESSSMYKVGDKLKFSIDLHELKNGYWMPYQANDVQLEMVMLNPYFRVFLDPPEDHMSPTFSKTFVAPDQYGVFKFVISYSKLGYNPVTVESLAPLRNFKHNDYPRFLLRALPYYGSAFAVLAGALAFAFFYLFTVPKQISEKKK